MTPRRLYSTRAAQMTGALALAAIVAVAGCKPAAPGAAGGGLTPASLTGSDMSTFTDPSEGAFTLSAPAGWTMKGGVQRASAYDAKPWATATSPDGAEVIGYGDATIPSFVLPDGQHAEGASFDGPGGHQLYQSYETGAQYAADYAQRAMGGNCDSLQPAGSQAEPDLAQKAAAAAASFSAQVGAGAQPPDFDGGSATFTCQGAGGATTVGVIAVTAITRFGNGGGSWYVPTLVSYRAPVAQQADADKVARAMLASFQKNPQWDAKMAEATRQEIALIRQQGSQQLASQAQMEAQQTAGSLAYGEANGAARQASQQQFMNGFNAQGEARTAAFQRRMIQKDSGQQAEMRYIQNQQCAVWYDAAHTQCKITVQQ
ncbi:MAG TPA: hypothetical protein VGI95_06185 [Caulobacteraceae bacterium]|jgi:hypothetical protein